MILFFDNFQQNQFGYGNAGCHLFLYKSYLLRTNILQTKQQMAVPQKINKQKNVFGTSLGFAFLKLIFDCNYVRFILQLNRLVKMT